MSEHLLPYQPSLASATSTRVDSACKHHQQCRVSTDDMLMLIEPKNDPKELQINKYRYCVHKDEMVLCVGRPWLAEKARKKTNNAYPRVISNLGMFDGVNEGQVFTKMLTYMYHYCRSIRDKRAIIRYFEGGIYEIGYFQPGDNTRDNLTYMYDYMPMGYAQTLGWAHPANGDTMTTVMVGGMRTVMNGDFEINTTDPIQWYWPFELNCFHTNGVRKSFPVDSEDKFGPTCNRSPFIEYVDDDNNEEETKVHLEEDALDRKKFHNKIYGQPKGKDKVVPRIKPFIKDVNNPRIYDEMRVFAVAMSCARPHEMVDIKICRQSM